MKIRINLTEAKKVVDPKKVAADKKAEAKKVADKKKADEKKKAEDKKKVEAKKKADAKKKLKESLYPIVKQMLAENAVEEVKEEGDKMEESVLADPNFWAGVGGLLLGSIPFIKMKYDQWKNAKTPEEKKKLEQELSDAISKKMGGGM